MIPQWRKQLYGNIVGLLKERIDGLSETYKAHSGTVYIKSQDIEIRISSHLRTKPSDRKYAFDILTKNRRRQLEWNEIKQQIEDIIAAIKLLRNLEKHQGGCHHVFFGSSETETTGEETASPEHSGHTGEAQGD